MYTLRPGEERGVRVAVMQVSTLALALLQVSALAMASAVANQRVLNVQHRPRLPVMATSTPIDVALSGLCSWIQASGGETDAIQVGEIDGMRGCILGREISPLQNELMRVPGALGINDDVDELVGTPTGAALGRSGLLAMQPDARLALRLLHEESLGSSSPWHEYISLLPSHVGCARHLSDDVLLECRSDFVMKQAMLARKYVESLAKNLAGAGLGEAAARIGWAVDIVHSRSFSVDMGPRGLRRVLVPFIDFLNCSPGVGCSFTYDDTDEPPSFVIELVGGEAPPPVGQQIFLDYGPQTSEELLLMYGFVPSGPTPSDVISLVGAYTPADLADLADLTAPTDVERPAAGEGAAVGGSTLSEAAAAPWLREEKEARLATLRYVPPRTFELSARQIDPGIVCALRLATLTQVELDECCGGDWNRPLAHAPVSMANEARVARALRARLRAMLDDEPTSLEGDRRRMRRLSRRAAAGAAAAGDGSGDEGEEADADDEWDEDEDLDSGEAAAMCFGIGLRANRKAVLAETVDVLDRFLAQLPTAEPTRQPPAGSDGGDVEDGAGVANLLDFMEDYMPRMRML